MRNTGTNVLDMFYVQSAPDALEVFCTYNYNRRLNNCLLAEGTNFTLTMITKFVVVVVVLFLFILWISIDGSSNQINSQKINNKNNTAETTTKGYKKKIRALHTTRIITGKY